MKADVMRIGSIRGNLILTTAAIVALVMPVFLAFITASPLRAQASSGQQPAAQATGAPLPSFEVVSIKPNHSEPGVIPAPTKPDPGWFVATLTVKSIIEFAFNVRDFQISGSPSWIGGEKFDIDAKVQDSVAEELRKLPREQQIDRMRLMVQSLLADRFALKVHHETKDLPTFAMTIAKGGPKLTESIAPAADLQGSSPPLPGRGGSPPMPMPGAVMIRMGIAGQMTLIGKSAPLSKLVFMLSQQFNLPILDQTGLKGTYDFTLEWTSETGLGGAPLSRAPGVADSPAPDPYGISIFTAIQDQLGLKLVSTKGPFDIIVIDYVERPSPN
jgi:uncharacterized protein (TIGR03435 family)